MSDLGDTSGMTESEQEEFMKELEAMEVELCEFWVKLLESSGGGE